MSRAKVSDRQVLQGKGRERFRLNGRNRVTFFALLMLSCVFLASNHIAILRDLYEKKAICVEMEEQCTPKEVFQLFDEAEYFPVTTMKRNQKKAADKGAELYYFENGYGTERTYGGKRKHEGIDIISAKDEVGILEICSVTDGVVERLGWNRLGGYRVGIRSENGNYYYYAHLDSYEPKLQEGDKVRAGQRLGVMGNTGYGKEGTKGKFVVHLHFGIYRKENNREVSINPYYILKHIQKNRSSEG